MQDDILKLLFAIGGAEEGCFLTFLYRIRKGPFASSLPPKIPRGHIAKNRKKDAEQQSWHIRKKVLIEGCKLYILDLKIYAISFNLRDYALFYDNKTMNCDLAELLFS